MEIASSKGDVFSGESKFGELYVDSVQMVKPYTIRLDSKSITDVVIRARTAKEGCECDFELMFANGQALSFLTHLKFSKIQTAKTRNLIPVLDP